MIDKMEDSGQGKLKSIYHAALGLWQIFDRRMKVQIVGLLFMMLLIGVLEGLGIGLILPVFHLVSDPSSVSTNKWLTFLHEFLGEPSHEGFIIAIFVGLFILFLIKNIIIAVNTYFQAHWAWHGNARTASDLVASYINMPYENYLDRDTSDFIKNATRSINEIFQGMMVPLMNIMAEIIVATAIISVLIIARPLEAALVALLLGLPTAIYLHVSRPYLARWGFIVNDLASKNLAALAEIFGTVKEAKILGREKHIIESYSQIPFAEASKRKKRLVLMGIPRLLLETLTVASLLLLAAIILSQSGEPSKIVPTLGLFVAATFRLMPSANRIASQLNTITFALPAVQGVQRDLKLSNPVGLAEAFRGDRKVNLRNISFDKVCYRFPQSDQNALHEIDLEIKKGEAIAFVGASGAGKSTLANVLLGLLVPTSGRVTINGEAFNSLADIWRGLVGFVPQDTFLINDTLRRNIAFAIPVEDIDDELVMQAVRTAHIEQFVDDLPDGLDTMVGEKGLRLSGGQKQRVAIARAIYSGPEIIILDEATSSLDAESEAAISTAIQSLKGSKTLIVIAHRLSSVKNCDRLYWMENGQIVDSGDFNGLAARNDKFAGMIRHLDLSPISASKNVSTDIP